MGALLLPLLCAGVLSDAGYLVTMHRNSTEADVREVRRVCGTSSAAFKFGGFSAVHCKGVSEREVEQLEQFLEGRVAVERDVVHEDVLHAMPGGCVEEAAGAEGLWGLSRLTHRQDWEASSSSSTSTSTRSQQSFKHNSEWGEGVYVFVLDTGVECGHRELKGRCYNGLDYKGVVSDELQRDDNGHGTYVASLVAGSTYGVARRATVMSTKVVSSSGTVLRSRVVEALTQVAVTSKMMRQPPSLVVMAFDPSDSETVRMAVRALIELGISVVTSSGNNRGNTLSKRVDEVITVGAHNKEGETTGSVLYADLFAPGEGVLGASADDLDGGVTKSGSSAAAGYAAGAAAAFLSGNPAASPLDVKVWLRESALEGVLVKATPNKALFMRCDESQSTTPGDGAQFLGTGICGGSVVPSTSTTGTVSYKTTRFESKCWVMLCPTVGEELHVTMGSVEPSDGMNLANLHSLDNFYQPEQEVWEGDTSPGHPLVVPGGAAMIVSSQTRSVGAQFEFSWECKTPMMRPRCTAVAPSSEEEGGGGVLSYPVDNGRYPAFADECWTLSCSTQHMEVRWQYLDVTSEDNTDLLTLEEEKDDGEWVVATHLSGQAAPPPRSFERSLRVRFRSGFHPKGSGFRFSWTCKNNPLPEPAPFTPPGFEEGRAVTVSSTALVTRKATAGSTVKYLLECGGGGRSEVVNAKWHIAYNESIEIRDGAQQMLLQRVGFGEGSSDRVSTNGNLEVVVVYETRPFSTFELEFNCLPADPCPELPARTPTSVVNGDCFRVGCDGESLFSAANLVGSVTLLDLETGTVVRGQDTFMSRHLAHRTQVVVHGSATLSWGCGRWGSCTTVDYNNDNDEKNDRFRINGEDAMGVDCWHFRCPLPSQKIVFRGFTTTCGYSTPLLDTEENPLATADCRTRVVATNVNSAVLGRTRKAMTLNWSCKCQDLTAAVLTYPRQDVEETGKECWTIRCDQTVTLNLTLGGTQGTQGNYVQVVDSNRYAANLVRSIVVSLTGDVVVTSNIRNIGTYGLGEAFSLDWTCGVPETDAPRTLSPPTGDCQRLSGWSGSFSTNETDETTTCWYITLNPPERLYINVAYDLREGDGRFEVDTGDEVENYRIVGGNGYQYQIMEVTRNAVLMTKSGGGWAQVSWNYKCAPQSRVPGLVEVERDSPVHCWDLTCDYSVPLTLTHVSGAALSVKSNSNSDGDGLPLGPANPTVRMTKTAAVSLEAALPLGSAASFSWTCDYSSLIPVKEHCSAYSTYGSDTGSLTLQREKCVRLTCEKPVKVLTMNLELEAGYDYVEVYKADGRTPLDRFTGTGTVHVGYTGDIVVKAAFDETVDSKFELRWLCGEEVPERSVELSVPSNPIAWGKNDRNCDHSFESYSRTVQYPAAAAAAADSGDEAEREDYLPLKSRCWRFGCPAGHESRVTLEASLEPGFDKVGVYGREGAWLGEVTGNETTVLASTGDLYLHFTSDLGTEGAGFTARHFCRDPPVTAAPTLEPEPVPPTQEPVTLSPETGLRGVQAVFRIASSDMGKAVAGSRDLMPALELLLGGRASCFNVCLERATSGYCVTCGEGASSTGRAAITTQQGSAESITVRADLRVPSEMDNGAVRDRLQANKAMIEGRLGGELQDVTVTNERAPLPTPKEEDQQGGDGGDSLSTGAIVGIVFGSLVVVAVVAFLVYYFFLRKPKAAFSDSEPVKEERTTVV
eukprot:TRINITY_DN808_c0_g1_i1.p1 TRINITY_DN808_c0_g1~~TRINITY_DN808_c0_g1_i1.p1  ORF type:complete len:1725 (+),score=540.88 TRINITY_DN808_c0_g1_i1:71-5176(+)